MTAAIDDVSGRSANGMIEDGALADAFAGRRDGGQREEPFTQRIYDPLRGVRESA